MFCYNAQVSTIVQLTMLAPANSADSAAEALPHQELLCVANTHLFFHPCAPHIRYSVRHGGHHRRASAWKHLHTVRRLREALPCAAHQEHSRGCHVGGGRRTHECIA